MLKSYLQFINEQKKEAPKLTDREQRILYEFLELSKEHGGDYPSFSSIALNNESDGDEILHYAKEFGNRYGYEEVKKFINDHDDYVHSFFYEGSYKKYDTKKVANENAWMDIFLNYFAPNHFTLGGYMIVDDVNLLIRYFYGWHHNKYGKMAIEQEFGSVEKYFEFINDELSKEKDGYYEWDFEIADAEAKYKNIFIIKPDKWGDDYERFIDTHKKSIQKGDLKVVKSKSTDYYMAILTFGNFSKYSNDHIVDMMIEGDLQKYFTVFDFDTSHIDDDDIKKYSKVSKTMGRYNI